MHKFPAGRKPVEVKVAMTRAEVTGSMLAEHLGISAAAVSRRLSGEVDFSMGEVTAMAELLRVQPADLVPTMDALAEERAS